MGLRGSANRAHRIRFKGFPEIIQQNSLTKTGIATRKKAALFTGACCWRYIHTGGREYL
jgi:hypothetical protein